MKSFNQNEEHCIPCDSLFYFVGFSGQIVFIGDSMGSILAYDALTRHSYSAQYTIDEELPSSPGEEINRRSQDC